MEQLGNLQQLLCRPANGNGGAWVCCGGVWKAELRGEFSVACDELVTTFHITRRYGMHSTRHLPMVLAVKNLVIHGSVQADGSYTRRRESALTRS